MKDHYEQEAEFEEDLVCMLVEKKGWKDGVIEYPDEAALLENWAKILLRNNGGRDQLNGVPLSRGEMAQVIEQVRAADTPFKANRLITGGSLHIRRDNPDDAEHLGQEVYIKLFATEDVAGGSCVYQIARQPRFAARDSMYPDRRGDFMLLINGMPVIHVELKRSKVSWTEALHQIELYTNEGVFEGLFGLVQIFVCMTPEETRYLANPGREGLENRARAFNRKFIFTWADENNHPVNEWHRVAERLLSIPMAHRMVASYTVADAGDGAALKVLRSYQYMAVDAIIKKLETAAGVWGFKRPAGGYVWHTTGSGKTLTSFKAAQLAARSKLVDKSVFIVDRIELGTQTLGEYKGFADPRETINDTDNAAELLALLKDGADHGKTLIVTSINKLSIVAKDKATENDKRALSAKRIVIVADECHRSTFGEMMGNIKAAFPNAMLIGFTGTPISPENNKNTSTTYDVFGEEIARYSIADGIRDGNVLKFLLKKVETFPSDELRRAVALRKAGAKSYEEVEDDEEKRAIYEKYMDERKYPMAGFREEGGRYHRGIEDFVPSSQYDCEEHREKVVEDIGRNWDMETGAGRLHGMLATSSIAEAMDYYRLVKKTLPHLAATCLFDPTLDNEAGVVLKEEMLAEILKDYNARFGTPFSIATHDEFKADAAARMAHKGAYKNVEQKPEQKLDLMIVVNQMLTGYDSKWLGVLYVDKQLSYENIIQAFSRTNRLLDSSKGQGIIRYYRRVHTMDRDIRAAIELYSGGAALDLYVYSICQNVKLINDEAARIDAIFKGARIEDFSRLPNSKADQEMFRKEYNIMHKALRAAIVQGFSFEQTHYECVANLSDEVETADCMLTKEHFEILSLRYRELEKKDGDAGEGAAPLDVSARDAAVVGRETVDTQYFDEHFQNFVKTVHEDKTKEEIDAALDSLHSAYPHLSSEDQKAVDHVVAGIRSGKVEIRDGWSWFDYVNHLREKKFREQVEMTAKCFGVDAAKLSSLVRQKPSEEDVNEYGRFDELLADLDRDQARRSLERLSGHEVKAREVVRVADSVLRRFVVEGGCDLREAAKEELGK